MRECRVRPANPSRGKPPKAQRRRRRGRQGRSRRAKKPQPRRRRRRASRGKELGCGVQHKEGWPKSPVGPTIAGTSGGRHLCPIPIPNTLHIAWLQLLQPPTPLFSTISPFSSFSYLDREPVPSVYQYQLFFTFVFIF